MLLPYIMLLSLVILQKPDKILICCLCIKFFFFSFTTIKGLPLRVPGVRVDQEKIDPKNKMTPTRSQYIESLCQLRNLSLAQKLPSAFVIGLSILRSKKVSN